MGFSQIASWQDLHLRQAIAPNATITTAIPIVDAGTFLPMGCPGMLSFVKMLDECTLKPIASAYVDLYRRYGLLST